MTTLLEKAKSAPTGRNVDIDNFGDNKEQVRVLQDIIDTQVKPRLLTQLLNK